MAARGTPKAPTPVDAIRHGDKRVNIPTADAEEFVDPSVQALQRAVYERDASLDPQLVWRSKFDKDVDKLVADAPPIYIQEKIDARVLVENLRKTSAAGAPEPEATLFDDFDGLGELDVVDFYKHDANWSNRMILGDSLQVMASLREREALRGKVQMVYIDPPYGIRFGSNWQASARKRDVGDGKVEDAAREAEQIKAFRDTWELGIHSYLAYLRDRLVVARDLLTDSGSCFVQIGDENVHLVRSLMDEVFGRDNFVSQISFAKTTGQETLQLANVIDYILWYGRDATQCKVRRLLRPKVVGGFGAKEYKRVELKDGTSRSASAEELSGTSSLPEGARLFTTGDVTSDGGEAADVELPDGRILVGKTGVHWKTTKEGMLRLWHANRLMPTGGYRIYKRYFDDFPVVGATNLWADVRSESDRAYVVQTAASVIERCVLMATDPGDLVLDPTCGSGTTGFVSEQWGRRWITIDTSRVALAIARQRLMGARYPYYLLADSNEGRLKQAQLAGGTSSRSDARPDIRLGFVYDRVPHVTLRSIANNPDIVEGMSIAEVDAAVSRYSEFELLYDRPFVDNRAVRVSGPFSVESLAPHRSLTMPSGGLGEARSAPGPDPQPTGSPGVAFEQSIIENLAKAGVQNGRRAERFEFSSLASYPGRYIQARGESAAAPGAGESKVAIAIGPQYGTVSPAFIKDAAREAIRAGDIDLLCILGFAFDPQATGVTEDDTVSVEASDEGFALVAGERSLGRIRVLLVRMNADLLMGEELKKTGAGNLFTVFGEPDIELTRTAAGEIVVDLRGVDVYDPTTGEVRSGGTGQIALWMIDTDYNEESFFVRHCYFTGGNDPLKKLKDALKADINAEAWETMYRTKSRPFEPPSTGKIAVKVINDYGDEVMKVFTIDK